MSSSLCWSSKGAGTLHLFLNTSFLIIVAASFIGGPIIAQNNSVYHKFDSGKGDSPSINGFL